MNGQNSLLAGVNVLLEGPTGCGKTYSLGTLVDSGVETFVLFTENGLETLLGYWTDRKLEVPDNLRWHVLDRGTNTFDTMAKAAETINLLDLAALAKMQDVNRSKHNQFTGLLKSLSNFTDDRTGKSFGSVDTFGPDRCLVIDSLSGVNAIALSLVVGSKPVRSMSDWGISMSLIENLLRQLCDGCKCHFVLTAHVERETDMVLGGVKLTVATLGNKLAPKLTPLFSDVIMTTRDGIKFYWDTSNTQADLKARNVPIANHIDPSFKQIMEKWKSRGGAFTPLVQK